MAEAFVQFKLFEYHKNSNLVLRGDNAGPTHSEPTGEPEPLTGRIIHKMGDKVVYERPKELTEKSTKRENTFELKSKLKRPRLGITKGATVLDTDVTENTKYRPTTTQTTFYYEQLLNLLQTQLGDQPDVTLKEAADEILAALKVENTKETEKRKHVEEVLGKIDDTTFTSFSQLSKVIVDYDQGLKNQLDMEDNTGDIEDPTGVHVVFTIDDQENDILGDSEEESEDDDNTHLNGENQQERHLALRHVDEDEELYEKDKYSLEVSKIDSHWLQRLLLSIYDDFNVALATEREILSILPTQDIQECENKLVFILKYDNFNIAKLILKNRWKIFYCTRLEQAQTAEEKKSIREEMATTEEGQVVAELLDNVSLPVDRGREATRNVRKEAATLAAKAQLSEKQHKNEDTDEYNIGNINNTDFNENEDKKPTRLLDLENLMFTDGGHLMSNARVQLPEGSQRIEKKSYDEVIVQPYKRPVSNNEEKKAISDIPAWAQLAFANTKETHLNVIQTQVYKTAFEDYHENMLVCAPTGAGKTNIALLTILNVISQYRTPSGHIDLHNFKIIYISPMKALVGEQVQAFSQKLKEAYNINVRELTGDVSLNREQIEDTQVIITTPEKWDIITRKAGDRAFTQYVKLLIIDEIHLLHDTRGPVLEAIIARTIRHVQTTQEYIRIVGLSATLPNYQDVAFLLRVKADKGLFYFGNHYRPVPLLQTYIGIKDKKAIKRYNTMNQVTYEKVMEKAGKNQILVFVHSRKETVKTAKAIRDLALQNDTLAKFLQNDSASREILQVESEAIKTLELKDLLPYGFAVHHAGLPRTDRKMVEDLFADKHIQVLVSTSTLAWGVNLPAHTVIIKGTQVYIPEKGCWCELSSLDVMQMMGRGGRPQYDSTGHGIIITTHNELQFYLSLNNQQLPVESQLISSLPDILNAEIVLGTVRTRMEGVDWLKYTYLYIRMLRNPQLYGVDMEDVDKDPLLQQRCIDIIHTSLIVLDKHNLIKYDRKTGHCQITALGRVASHYYIKSPTISVLNEHLKPSISDIELFRLFSLSNEFKYIPVREEEKIELLKLMERVPIPVKGSCDEACSKINVLLQAYISKLRLEGFSLMSDMVYVQQSAARIMRAIFQICLKRQWAALSRKTLQLCKMIERRMWGSMSCLRQFVGIPEEVIRRIEKKEVGWSMLYSMSSSEIGDLLRMPRIGASIHRYIHQFPKVDINAYVQPLSRTCLSVELTITPDFVWETKIHQKNEVFWVFVEDVDSEVLLHHQLFILKQFHHIQTNIDHTLTFIVPIHDILPPNIFIRVISDTWLHSETTLPVSLKTLILPQKNPPHTDLLDLQPLPITALRFPQAEAFYSKYFQTFNPIQTQVFSTLYNTNENVLICGPGGSGLTVCVEFGIFRMLRYDMIKRCVYVCGYEECVEERYREWSYKFGKQMGLVVNKLCGEMYTDLKTLEVSNIIITTPNKWDYLSRRWKNRRVLQNITLFIVDHLHLLNTNIGPSLEVSVSRMRYISAQLQTPIRLIGIAASIANAKDLAEWIGTTSNGFFNFHPNVRTVPLEISMHGFEIHHRQSRLLSMAKPVYQAIKHYSNNKPTLIYTPDRKQCRLTAIDLLLQSSADGTPYRFLNASEDVIEGYIKGVSEKTLCETLRHGVGYIHEGMSREECTYIEGMYVGGIIGVLITTESNAWGMSLHGYLVIIMDTCKYVGNSNNNNYNNSNTNTNTHTNNPPPPSSTYNSNNNNYVDYPIHNILQMIASAARPYKDTNAVVVLLCPSQTKEYYKKYIFEPLPIESHLDQHLPDFINAEIVLKTIENKQDAVDWLTWTFFYRRLKKNPNYYGLQGISHQHLSDHLSELIESTMSTLEQCQCISLEDELEVEALNLGYICGFYYINFTTIEVFNKSLSESTKRKGILEILCAASEFDSVALRIGEEGTLHTLSTTLGNNNTTISSHNNDVQDPHSKALLLLYAHFNRTPLSSDLASDQAKLLEISLRLIHAMVDVISSNGWLQPALVAMEISQMIVQAFNSTFSPLKQLPHFNTQLIKQANTQFNVHDIFDLMNMEDDDRTKLLSSLTEAQMADVAHACNRYPVITLDYTIQPPNSNNKNSNSNDNENQNHTTTTTTHHQQLSSSSSSNNNNNIIHTFAPNQTVTCTINLDRDITDETLGPVYAPFFPTHKDEQWWIVIGKPQNNTLTAIKRITVNKQNTNIKLSFEAPNNPDKHTYTLFLMSDSYIGSDQEYKFTINVQ